ncbi:hypothetical protein SDC9_118242 [bioreactor metagenome]|uniref:Uncharacterized protein n=1 Tax=bioreactor metagenome TaxID=1076179 RepID=A0A645C1Q9_9ZZZZ
MQRPVHHDVDIGRARVELDVVLIRQLIFAKLREFHFQAGLRGEIVELSLDVLGPDVIGKRHSHGVARRLRSFPSPTSRYHEGNSQCERDTHCM